MNETDVLVPKHYEEVLPMTDIQGIAVPGFLKPYQVLIGVNFGATADAVARTKKLLGEISGQIATSAQTLNDRRQFRARKAAGRRKAAAPTVLTAVGFTYQGLHKLTPGASAIPSDAFRQGMAARSAFLGDPPDPTDEGHPKRWKVGGAGAELDAMFVVAGDTRAAVDERAATLSAQLKKRGLEITYHEQGGVRSDLPGHEHFGFDDGISQPGVRGRASDAPDDFVTPRHLAASQQQDYALFGYPGQDLVWPGVFLLGHRSTSPDPLIPGLPAPAIPDWTKNGSYLVFRRLRQDVGLFWRAMKGEAARLATLPGFAGMTDEELAARIVGRWRSGAPLNRVPVKDDPKLGKEPLANNHFRFDSDAEPLPLASGFVDTFPPSKADPAGITCPWAAHIRKVNTRDSGSDVGGREATYARRLLRVGVPFGKPLKDRYADNRHDPEKGNRGLLFLSIQASIEDQFEFLMARWMGDPSRPKMPGGHDLLVGQNDAAGEARVRRCVIFGSGVQQAEVATDAQWIIPTGGAYLFVPSITALREVIGG
jgi:Dyp-type peroxidase family